MGHGRYSSYDRAVRADSLGYTTKSAVEIFRQRDINSEMNPKGVKIRESRDSDDHPNSLSIILGLDLTGSMGSIPHYLVKEGLPNIMSSIIEGGVPDPQLMFIGVGDHEVDSAPLQIGQFESSDELLDKWLTTVYIEGGGGANYGESYLLAWYFAGFHTSIDCWEKRKQKGLIFTIGDEPTLRNIGIHDLKRIMGDGQYQRFTHLDLFEKAKEKYDVYHLHLKQGSNGMSKDVMRTWDFMGDNFIIIDDKKDVSRVITEIVLERKNAEFIKDSDLEL